MNSIELLLLEERNPDSEIRLHIEIISLFLTLKFVAIHQVQTNDLSILLSLPYAYRISSVCHVDNVGVSLINRSCVSFFSIPNFRPEVCTFCGLSSKTILVGGLAEPPTISNS